MVFFSPYLVLFLLQLNLDVGQLCPQLLVGCLKSGQGVGPFPLPPAPRPRSLGHQHNCTILDNVQFDFTWS